MCWYRSFRQGLKYSVFQNLPQICTASASSKPLNYTSAGAVKICGKFWGSQYILNEV